MNDYYSDSGVPATNAQGSSATIRAEFQLIEAAFGKLPTLTGNEGKLVAVNSGATALEAIATTGTGSAVRATSPTLVTPTLGVASATSVNKVTITAPASGSTITIANGKTLTVNNTIGLTGTDGTTLNLNAIATINAGRYTPTAVGAANVASITGLSSHWIRVGNEVFVSGELTVDPTTGSTLTSFTLTLPVASTFGSSTDLSGVAVLSEFVTLAGFSFRASGSTDVALFQGVCGNATITTLGFSFSYQVI